MLSWHMSFWCMWPCYMYITWRMLLASGCQEIKHLLLLSSLTWQSFRVYISLYKDLKHSWRNIILIHVPKLEPCTKLVTWWKRWQRALKFPQKSNHERDNNMHKHVTCPMSLGLSWARGQVESWPWECLVIINAHTSVQIGTCGETKDKGINMPSASMS